MADYHELVFEGSLPVVRAFLTGLRLGKGWATDFLCCEESGIRGDSFGHKVLEKIKLTKDLTYVVVIDRQVAAITEAAKAARPPLELAIRRDRPVREASFEYRFRVFERKDAARLRRLLENPAGGVAHADAELSEEEHPEGKGVEGYAPEHEYVFKGRGTVRGALSDVLAYREAMARFPQVEVDKVSLVLR